jgi:hypothetical protein
MNHSAPQDGPESVRKATLRTPEDRKVAFLNCIEGGGNQ